MESYYRHDGLIPRATLALIDYHKWITLNGPMVLYIPTDAMMFNDPSNRLNEFDVGGLPTSIDWSIQSDWYDRTVHWRGFTPMGVLDDDLWQLLEVHITQENDYPPKFVLNQTICQERRNVIVNINRLAQLVSDHLHLAETDVPRPSHDLTSLLFKLYVSKDFALQALARSRFLYLDFLGYFCWLFITFEEVINTLQFPSFITKERERLSSVLLAPKSGYLVDVVRYWNEINIPLWVENKIPFRYFWSLTLAADPRFRCLDPSFLFAHDQDEDGFVYEEEVLRDPSIWPEVADYDKWLQLITKPEDNLPERTDTYLYQDTLQHHVVDFDNWSKRPNITNLQKSFYFTTLFYCERIDEIGGIRVYYRHRLRFSVEYSSGDEDIEHYSRIPPATDLENTRIIRELYKFHFAPCQENSNENTELNTTSQYQIAPKTSEKEVPQSESDEDLYGPFPNAPQTSVTLPRSKEKLPLQTLEERISDHTSDRGSVSSRQRSASTTPRSRASDSGIGYRPSAHRSADTRAGQRRSCTSSWAAPATSVDSARETFARQIGNSWLTPSAPITSLALRAYPSNIITPPSRVWNENYLSLGVIHFNDVRSEVLLRIWALLDRGLDKAALLSRALDRHLPLSLEIPCEHLSQFKTEFSELDWAAAVHYAPGHRNDPLVYSSDGLGLARSYHSRLADLLSCPNAQAFFYLGGLISRIARAYAPASLLDSVVFGPSAQVTLHNRGNSVLTRDTQTDEVTPWEKALLLGHCSPLTTSGKTVDRWLWPTEELFFTEFQHWDGEWTDVCEEWFLSHVNRIAAGTAQPHSLSEWHNSIRSFLRRQPAPPRTAHSEWEAILESFRSRTQTSWNNQTFGSITLPEYFANNH